MNHSTLLSCGFGEDRDAFGAGGAGVLALAAAGATLADADLHVVDQERPRADGADVDADGAILAR